MRFPVRSLILILVLWSFPALAIGPFKNWKTIENCKLVEGGNDGDSFRIKYKSKSFVVRVYAVDTCETDAGLKERVLDQGRYFNINKSQVGRMARIAKKFTKEKLSKPFTVYTKFEDALGDGDNIRYLSFVKLHDGSDLSELLISNGLARIYGSVQTRPDGQRGSEHQAYLRTLERKAKAKKLGCWKYSKQRAPTAESSGEWIDFKKEKENTAPPTEWDFYYDQAKAPRTISFFIEPVPGRPSGYINRGDEVQPLSLEKSGLIKVRLKDKRSGVFKDVYCNRSDFSWFEGLKKLD